MSESYDKEIHNPLAFGREETESDVLRVSEGANEESVESEGIVEGFIEKGRVGIEEQSVSYWGEVYREMQKNYVMLAAVANWVFDMPHTREMGSSN